MSSATTAGYDSEHVIATTYSGPGEPIKINHVRRFTWPIDVILPTEGSFSTFELLDLGGTAAVLYYPKPGALLGSDLTALSYVTDGVETTILGNHLDPKTATRIASSLLCGASCGASGLGPEALVVERISPDIPKLALALGASPGVVATANPAGTGSPQFVGDEHRVIAGPQITSLLVTSWWNHPPASEYPLDLQHPSGSDASANLPVNFSSWPWSGTGRLYLTTEEYRHNPSYCDGRVVVAKDAGGNELGRLVYVHLQAATEIPIGATWSTNLGFWTIRNVGYVAVSQDPNCPWSADGKHLHQGRTVASPRITHNTLLPQPFAVINPTNDVGVNWMHQVFLLDSDGDGCSDEEELGPNRDLGGQRNPHNYRDFYDITNNTGVISAKDKAVTGFDLSLLLAWGGATENGPPNPNGKDYDADTNGNGLKDGWEIDFAGLAGPADGPDGAITGFDLSSLLSQGGDSCVAPP